jgi:hypothetical protein
MGQLGQSRSGEHSGNDRPALVIDHQLAGVGDVAALGVRAGNLPGGFRQAGQAWGWHPRAWLPVPGVPGRGRGVQIAAIVTALQIRTLITTTAAASTATTQAPASLSRLWLAGT